MRIKWEKGNKDGNKKNELIGDIFYYFSLFNKKIKK